MADPTLWNPTANPEPQTNLYGTRTQLADVPPGDSGAIRPMRRPVESDLPELNTRSAPLRPTLESDLSDLTPGPMLRAMAMMADAVLHPATAEPQGVQVSRLHAAVLPPIPPDSIAGHKSRWAVAEDDTVERLLTGDTPCPDAESFIADYTRDTGKTRTAKALADALKRIEAERKLRFPPAIYKGLLAIVYRTRAPATPMTAGNPNADVKAEAVWATWEEAALIAATSVSTTAEALCAVMAEAGSHRSPIAYAGRIRRLIKAGALDVGACDHGPQYMAYLLARAGRKTPPRDSELTSEPSGVVGPEAPTVGTGATPPPAEPVQPPLDQVRPVSVLSAVWKVEKIAEILDLNWDGILTDDHALAAIRRVRAYIKA